MMSKPKPRIAIIFHNSDYFSGATRAMLEIVEKWKQKDTFHIVAIFPGEGTATEYINKLGIETICIVEYGDIRIDISQSIFRLLISYPIHVYRALISKHKVQSVLSQKVRELGINLIYVNTSVIFTGSWLQKVLNIPVIWHIREFGEEDQNSKMIFGRNNFRKKLKKCSRIIVISKALLSKVINLIDKDKVNIVYDNVSSSYINKCDHINKDDTVNLLLIGNMIEGKGHMDALAAMKILVDHNVKVKLNIAGDIPENSSYFHKLTSYIKMNKLDEYVEFLGKIIDVNTLRKNMDIGVVSSKCEAFGRVTIENMLSNIAVIGANSGSTPELIEEGKTGLLYSFGDAEDLADKIELLYNDRKLLRKIAENGYSYAMKFTGDSAANMLQDIIYETLKI